MDDLQKYLAKQLKDPEFKKEWDKIIATPPGETIREQLEDYNMMTQEEFANKMGMTGKEAESLLKGEMPLTEDIDQKLEAVLGVPADFWNKLEKRYREKLAMKK